ncbi:TPR-like protein [Rickenella mellea]|uniref:TPR-like protein n=1 Tax=Rickenella mellea TaxID=50990 RepID=A0A4Y7PN13_9AGAM|nr:TPR-like protein [Rickenella mellea]
MSSTPTDTQTLTVVERVQSFVSEHKQAIIIGAAAAVAIGGVAYYASTSSAGDASSRSGRRKKKKGKKGGNGKDSPIIEEKERDPEELDEPALTTEQIAALTPEERDAKALQYKTDGNAAFHARQFRLAAELYIRAIAVAAKPEAVFYSNLAACYANSPQPDHEKTVANCDEALKLDPMYVKALNRRAGALEKLGKLTEALRDYTAVTILERFANEKSSKNVERMIQVLTDRQFKKIREEKKLKMPPPTFIDAYFGAFRERPRPPFPSPKPGSDTKGSDTKPETGDETLKLALDALDARDYLHAFSLVNEALEQGESWDEGRAEALNLRGSFRFLSADTEGAHADLQEAIKLSPRSVQSRVKIASVYMEMGRGEEGFAALDDALKIDEKDGDIFYHRGQMMFIMERPKEAATCYEQAIALEPNFVFSQIQLAVVKYKMGKVDVAKKKFKEAIRNFPNRSEPYNYYGELLLDQQLWPEAVENFDIAIKLEKEKKPPMNVLPLVNKGLALYQWKQDIHTAEALGLEALAVDPECEAAVATIAQLSLQLGKVEMSARMFWKQAELTKVDAELVNALKFAFASDAQLEFMHNYPHIAKEFMAVTTPPAPASNTDAPQPGPSTSADPSSSTAPSETTAPAEGGERSQTEGHGGASESAGTTEETEETSPSHPPPPYTPS